jgi:hypothetical protein
MISVHYESIDGYYEARTCETIDGARAWAMHWVGQHPTLGMAYAVSDDGVGKVTVHGCNIRDVFPEGAEYVFTLHTLDSHEHFGPFGSYKAAWNYGYDRRNTFQIQVQRVS